MTATRRSRRPIRAAVGVAMAVAALQATSAHACIIGDSSVPMPVDSERVIPTDPERVVFHARVDEVRRIVKVTTFSGGRPYLVGHEMHLTVLHKIKGEPESKVLIYISGCNRPGAYWGDMITVSGFYWRGAFVAD